MALNALLDVQVAVSNPQELFDFWIRRGMTGGSDGALGTTDRPVQLRVAEGSYRHLAELHLGCEHERDLSEIAGRLVAAGLEHRLDGTRLSCIDPVFGHRVVVEATAPRALTPAQNRLVNGPGTASRVDSRAGAVADRTATPRRIGHVVLGTPHTARAVDFYANILGFRISDQILKGVATFMRVETDHHNLMIQPGPTSYLNHYAVEVDDFDSIGLAGTAVVRENPEASVVGVGRHNLGSNVFWYLTDPSGNMFEFFSDMDQIVDDDEWERVHRRLDWEGADGPAGFSVWGPKDPPRRFFDPPDIQEIVAGRVAAGLG